MAGFVGTSWAAPPAPWFRARLVDGDVVIDGQPRVRLGHQIDVGRDRAPGGAWVEWEWDHDGLTARNDRYSAYPLYISSAADMVAVSPSIEALLALGLDRSIDHDALAAFLAIGWFSGTDTPFRSIRALPPAALLTWQSGRLRIVSSPPTGGRASISRADAVAGAAEAVRVAVQRCIPASPSDFIMPVSGGRDSRHILLELLYADHRPTRCVTAHHHPNVWGGDAPYAANLCRELRLEHHVVSPGPLVMDEWRKNRMTGYCSDEHAWYLSVADALNGQTAYTYDGINGSAILDHRYTPRMRRLTADGEFGTLAAELGRKYRGQPRYLPLLAPQAREALSAERATARIERELWRHADAPEPYIAFRFFGRSVRELNLAGTLMLHDVPTTYMPFLDPDYVSLAWSIPSEHVDQSFRDDVVAAHFPEANTIPYRARTEPQPDRAFLRQLNRDILDILRRHSDGSLVDRGALMRRAAVGSVTGDPWFGLMRRAALTVYLIQLESIASGRGPIDMVG